MGDNEKEGGETSSVAALAAALVAIGSSRHRHPFLARVDSCNSVIEQKIIMPKDILLISYKKKIKLGQLPSLGCMSVRQCNCDRMFFGAGFAVISRWKIHLAHEEESFAGAAKQTQSRGGNVMASEPSKGQLFFWGCVLDVSVG